MLRRDLTGSSKPEQLTALLTFVNESRQGQEQDLRDQLLVVVIPIDVLSDNAF
jgi:hypothetical protein